MRSSACSCLGLATKTLTVTATSTTTTYSCAQTEAVVSKNFESDNSVWSFSDNPANHSGPPSGIQTGVPDVSNHYALIGFQNGYGKSTHVMKQTLELCPDVGYQLQFGGLFHMDPQVNCTAQIALGNVQILYFPFTHGDSGPSLRTYQHPSLVTPRMSQADLTITLSCFGAQWRNGTSGSGYVYFDDASFKPSSHALGSEAANPEGQKPVKARYGPFGRQQ